MAIFAATCVCSLGFALVILLWRRSGRADVDALGDVEE
jgi:NADH:ubiquinone oxidoreductase subunit K